VLVSCGQIGRASALRELLQYLPPTLACDLVTDSFEQVGRDQKLDWCTRLGELSRMCNPRQHGRILDTAVGTGSLAPPLSARCFDND